MEPFRHRRAQLATAAFRVGPVASNCRLDWWAYLVHNNHAASHRQRWQGVALRPAPGLANPLAQRQLDQSDDRFLPMKRLPLLVLVFLILLLPAWIVWGQTRPSSKNDFALVARMPEDGGWSDEAIEVEVGRPVVFRLTSADVVHGFAIGRTGLQPVDIEPGKWTEFAWEPTRLGEYTFYCTRWCGANHWRMTGTIRVVDPSGSLPTPTSPPPPRYVQLGFDIDKRPVHENLKGVEPSAARGAALDVSPTVDWINNQGYEVTTPLEAWRSLRDDPTASTLTDEQIWDWVADLWLNELDKAQVQAGEVIYRSICSACHGQQGAGDGVMAVHFSDPSVADFTDLAQMATANNVILQGKILRGGMGTGMPYWGTILTDAEMRSVTSFLWKLLFSAGQPSE